MTAMPYTYPVRPFRMWRDQLSRFERERKEWIAEKKKNGTHLLVDRTDSGVVFWNRHKKIITDFRLDDLRARFMHLPLWTRLDGELIVKNELREIALWDVVILEGNYSKGDVDERGIELRRLMRYKQKPDAYILERYGRDFEERFEEAITEYPTVEGLVFKKRKSKYRIAFSGPNETPDWIKIRCYDDHMRVPGVKPF